MASILVHLVFIHGFQGNDTTFQSFPTHLHEHLSSRLPSHLKIQTSLYPTYKSVKPISHATRNFLGWLATQPPAAVILLGHSMGGLLAAEAATDTSNHAPSHPKPYRIIGLVAFDTPYLGMHPHIVISGIVSLLPKGRGGGDKMTELEKNKRTNNEMNDEKQVKIVDDNVTDEWEVFKKSLEVPGHRIFRPNSPHSRPASPSPTPSPGRISPFLDPTIALLSSHGNERFARWLRKHGDEPFTAGVRWVVEHFQFGVCMFDPSGLKERYRKLVAWNGHWVNYWTETIPRKAKTKVSHEENVKQEQLLNDYVALVEADIPLHSVDPAVVSDPFETKSAEPRLESESKIQKSNFAVPKELPAIEKSKGKGFVPDLCEWDREKLIPARRFIIRPVGLSSTLGGADRWEKVRIGGVEDEVAAHCGLFIPGQNLEYEDFVERVGKMVLGWCETL